MLRPLPILVAPRNRFKLLKKRKGDQKSDSRKKSETSSLTSDSPLLASSSFPANKRYGIKSPLTSPTTTSLTQSAMETARQMEGESSVHRSTPEMRPPL